MSLTEMAAGPFPPPSPTLGGGAGSGLFFDAPLGPNDDLLIGQVQVLYLLLKQFMLIVIVPSCMQCSVL